MTDPKREPDDPRREHERHTDYRVESASYDEPPTPEAIQNQKERQLRALRLLREKILAGQPQEPEEEPQA